MHDDFEGKTEEKTKWGACRSYLSCVADGGGNGPEEEDAEDGQRGRRERCGTATKTDREGVREWKCSYEEPSVGALVYDFVGFH
jgi:hypothetical protein